MNPIVTPQLDQAFAFGLYNRALHPEFFELRNRKVVRHEGWELESWIVNGGHALRFGTGSACYSEVICWNESPLPSANAVTTFLCGGEHDLDERFEQDGPGAGARLAVAVDDVAGLRLDEQCPCVRSADVETQDHGIGG